MTKNQIDRMQKLLDELRQIIEELDDGPVECHACVDTDDMAYIELPIDGDGTARSLEDWASALEVLIALAHADWSQGELYTMFQAAMNNTNPFEQPMPDWEEVELLMAEHARLRRIYKNLIPFLEDPDAYAASLTNQVNDMVWAKWMTRDEARKQVAADALKALAEELEMARGEKATPSLYRAYANLEAEGNNYVLWISEWLKSTSEE